MNGAQKVVKKNKHSERERESVCVCVCVCYRWGGWKLSAVHMEQLSDFPLCLFWQEGEDTQQEEEGQKAEPEEPVMWEETFKSYTDSKPFGKLHACVCVCACLCV